MAGLPELLQAVKVALVLALMPAAMGSSLSSFWQIHLPHTSMPTDFQKLASSLSATLVQHYAGQFKAHTIQASKNEEFCSSAEIYCQQIVTVTGPQPRVCIPPFFFYEYNVLRCSRGTGAGAEMGSSAVEASASIFFSQDSLSVDKRGRLPSTSNNLKGLKFLPYSLAKLLPAVDVNSLAELASFYGITEGSEMELEMQNTAAHCGVKSEHEIKACVTSGEGMVSFVSETVGHDITAIAPPAIAAQEALIVDIRVVNSKGSKVASCHDMKFPSLLFSCHTTQSSQVLDVTLKLAGGAVVQMPAVCHTDTSYWNPSHIAFQVLMNAKPGATSICHWLPQNSFIFVEGAS